MASTKVLCYTEETCPADCDYLYLGKDGGCSGFDRHVTVSDLLAGVSPIGTQEIWIGAEAMKGETTGGAEFVTRELVTNDVMIDTMKFDTTAVEGAQFTWTPPANWNAGTVRGKLYWTTAGGSNCQTIDFDLSARSYGNACALDQTLDTGAQAITDTKEDCGNCELHISGFSSAMTITNAAAGEMVIFKLQRDTAADNLSVDAEIIGVIIEYSISAATAT